MRKTVFRTLGGALIGLGLVLGGSPATAVTTRITNDDVEDQHPDISGSNVVWMRCDAQLWSPLGCVYGDYEIYFWDGSFPIVPIQVTDNGTNDWHPTISGTNVVWWCDDGDWEICYWDGSFPIVPTQITHNSNNDRYPAISGTTVVWEHDAGETDEIHLWDGATITNISTETGNAWEPDISGSNVVWRGWGGLWLWDGVSASNITTPDEHSPIYHPAISGTNVVWQSWGSAGYDIYLWDGLSITDVSNSSSHDQYPDISGSNVVWLGGGGLLFWDGASTTWISNDSAWEESPAISGSRVVWARCDDGPAATCGWEDFEIYMYAPLDAVPSVSFGGLALLGGLLLGSVAWARRGS